MEDVWEDRTILMEVCWRIGGIASVGGEVERACALGIGGGFVWTEGGKHLMSRAMTTCLSCNQAGKMKPSLSISRRSSQ